MQVINRVQNELAAGVQAKLGITNPTLPDSININCAMLCRAMQCIDVQHRWSMLKCMCMTHTRWAFCSIVDHVPLKAYLPHAGWSRQQKSSMDLSSNPRTCICFRTWGCGLWSLIVMFMFVPGPGADFVQLASPRSVVFDQAENRLHAQKALMLNWPL